MIEILSPANERRGEGQDLSKRKPSEVLASTTSLVEIDLLRAGEPTVAFPQEQLGAAAYRVVVSRAPEHERRELYAIELRSRLPRVAIPVAPGVTDVVFDLPAILADVHEKGRSGDRLDSSKDPVPPLTSDDAAWARALVSQAPRAS